MFSNSFAECELIFNKHQKYFCGKKLKYWGIVKKNQNRFNQ